MVKAIVGGNWGDEGKGKITDLMAGEADIVVRFQGGANAGHTIINEYGKTALHLLPSGVFHPDVVNLIGQGVALHLPTFFKELDGLTAKGIPTPNLLVSDRAQIVMPYHILFDKLEEERLGGRSFGSTKSGIAPFYSDKYAKIGIQAGELYEDSLLKDRLDHVCEIKNAMIRALYKGAELLDPQAIYEEITSYRDRLKPMLVNAAVYLHEAKDKSILLEGQLGA
ncbi:MAG TPA: adenylosuccinate synthetase, partial [Clostridiales bacterium]|nr:adenylosuccinate synthetase [Clostridiales bacterium]